MIRTIVADPPWSYTDKKAGMKKTGKGADSHYKSMSLGDIANYLDNTTLAGCSVHNDEGAACGNCDSIGNWISKDAHLWLWVTNAFLVDGTGGVICHAWGFTPKTVVTWVKGRILPHRRGPMPYQPVLVQHIGQGSYLRNSTEHCIFAVRGKCPPAVRNLPTAFLALRTEHSRKPDAILEWAEKMSPPEYLELFARRRRPGWTQLGDELEADANPDDVSLEESGEQKIL